jgi:hypothetical protein
MPLSDIAIRSAKRRMHARASYKQAELTQEWRLG